MSEKTGRNDPCPCGSGKKYKRCCLGAAVGPDPTSQGEADVMALLQDEGITVMVTGDDRDEVVWRAGGRPFAIGGATLMKPDVTVELKYREEAAAHMLGLLPPGEYTDAKTISKAFNEQAEYLCESIDAQLALIGHEGSIEYFVFAHDQWSKAYDWVRDHIGDHEPGTLPREQAEWVLERAPLMRRALKELIERAVALYDPTHEYAGATDHWLRDVQRAVLLAEELMGLINFSDLSFRLFPEQTKLVVHEPDDWGRCYELHSDEAEQLMRLFRERRERFSRCDTTLVVETPSTEQVAAVNEHVMSEAGFQMSHAWLVLDQLKSVQTTSRSFLAKVPLGELATRVAEMHELNPGDVSKILRGWSIYRSGLPKTWESHRPKRDFRMLTRPLVLLENHPDGPLLIIPVASLDETFRMAFELWRRRHAFPSEWGVADDGESNTALKELGQAIDAQLEDRAAQVLNGAGLIGQRTEIDALERFGVLVPEEVGEIDYLGVHMERRLVVVAECKNLWAARSPRLYESEQREFFAANGHVAQLRRKFEWVSANVGEVTSALATKHGLEPVDGPWRVVPLLLTNEEHLVACQSAQVCIESVALLADDVDAGGLDWLCERPRFLGAPVT